MTTLRICAIGWLLLVTTACGDGIGFLTAGPGASGVPGETTATETGTPPMGTTDVGPTESGMTEETTGKNPSDPTTEGLPTSGTESGVATGDPKLEEAYLEWQKQMKDGYYHYCQCWVEGGAFDNVHECLQEYLPSPLLVSCNAEVISGFPQVEFIIGCYVAATAKHVQCTNTTECNSEAESICGLKWLEEFEECGFIPPDVIAEMQSVCEGIPPFICASGEKLPGGYQCDYQQNCMDNSDEMNCPGHYTCPSGGSTADHQKCNGHNHCKDGTDEQGCTQFMCTNGMMINELLHCNGPADCNDKSDEKNCPDRFTCIDGDSIPLDWKCDGSNDCSDESDEQGC